MWVPITRVCNDSIDERDQGGLRDVTSSERGLKGADLARMGAPAAVVSR